MAKSETERIADEIGRAIRGPAWHGPALLEAVSDMTPQQASAHPVPGAHSVWELVAHVTAWLEIVTLRLTGSAPSTITDAMDWPPVGSLTSTDWPQALARLETATAGLQAAAAALDEQQLDARLPASDDGWAFYTSLHGVVQHVAYHTGQILVLRKAARP